MYKSNLHISTLDIHDSLKPFEGGGDADTHLLGCDGVPGLHQVLLQDFHTWHIPAAHSDLHNCQCDDVHMIQILRAMRPEVLGPKVIKQIFAGFLDLFWTCGLVFHPAGRPEECHNALP